MSQRVNTRNIFFLLFIINIFPCHVQNSGNEFKLISMVFHAELRFHIATATLI